MKILSILFLSTIALTATTVLSKKVLWQDGPHNALYTMSFKQALSYCETLQYNGLKNWRIPNTRELTSIVDTHRIPTIKSTFNYSGVGCYWTYTNKQIGSVNFQEATISNHIKDINQECFVRCVKDK